MLSIFPPQAGLTQSASHPYPLTTAEKFFPVLHYLHHTLCFVIYDGKMQQMDINH